MNGEVLLDNPPGIIVQVELKLGRLVNRTLMTLQVLFLMLLARLFVGCLHDGDRGDDA